MRTSRNRARLDLLAQLDEGGRLPILSSKGLDLRGSCGMFSIPKSLQKDRLIFNARPSNLLMPIDTRWLRTLGAASTLLDLQLDDDEELLLSGEDVRDFYYNFHITEDGARLEDRARLYTLVGEYRSEELQHLPSFDASLLKVPSLVVALHTFWLWETVTQAPLARRPMLASCLQKTLFGFSSF